MLRKIWNFYRGDYEECRLLRYKKAVRTTQEKHYVSATNLDLLMLCKILCFHRGNYEEYRLLAYKTLFVPYRRLVISPLQGPAG
jgi:hypothetical protein